MIPKKKNRKRWLTERKRLPSDLMKKYTAGIVGGAGFAAGELIRIILTHPEITLKFVQSRSHAGQPVSQVHQDLIGDTELKFSDKIEAPVDVLFLAQSHGEAGKILDSTKVPADTRIIDLSQDFRFSSSDRFGFVYGLPEVNHNEVQRAKYLANPGCFATAILLGLLPLAAENLLTNAVHITAITGSTGAGQNPADTLHFSWRYSNLSVYKAFEHQHLHEINAQLRETGNHEIPPVYFVPVRGNFTRGILASITTGTERSLQDIAGIYTKYYKNAPFTIVTDANPDLKTVINTNKCLVFLQKHRDMLLIITVIDNLIKGAAGQAVQNMNLMLGLPEVSGLNLKASVY
jgi:N-acetyl-gamma-glutamyl-phosphate reductase